MHIIQELSESESSACCLLPSLLANGYRYLASEDGLLLVSVTLCRCFTGDSGIQRLLVTCYVSSAIGLTIIATHIYASSGVFGVYSDVKFVDAWSWWALQTLMRSEELAEVIVVICVAKRSILPKDALKRLASCLICRKKNSVRKIQILPLDDTFEQTKTINTGNLSSSIETKWWHCLYLISLSY